MALCTITDSSRMLMPALVCTVKHRPCITLTRQMSVELNNGKLYQHKICELQFHSIKSAGRRPEYKQLRSVWPLHGVKCLGRLSWKGFYLFSLPLQTLMALQIDYLKIKYFKCQQSHSHSKTHPRQTRHQKCWPKAWKH